MKQWLSYLLFCLLLGLIACTPTKNSKSPSATEAEKPLPQFDPERAQIVFFNLNIRKTTAPQNTVVELLETKVVTGKIKRDFPANVAHRPYQLLCSLLDKEENVLKQTTIAHPLYRRYEYQNDQGTLSSKVVASDNEQFSLRTQLTENIYYLKIEEILEDQQLNTLQMFLL